jgi:hypothetical protein
MKYFHKFQPKSVQPLITKYFSDKISEKYFIRKNQMSIQLFIDIVKTSFD